MLALVLAGVALLAGIFVTTQTFPSDEELQRVSLEELGLDPNLVDQPFVRVLLDQIQEPVRDRVLDETRQSMYLGAGTMVLITVAGVALIATDHNRRRSPEVPAAPATPTETVDQPS